MQVFYTVGNDRLEYNGPLEEEPLRKFIEKTLMTSSNNKEAIVKNGNIFIIPIKTFFHVSPEEEDSVLEEIMNTPFKLTKLD